MHVSFLARLRPKLESLERVVNTLRIIREEGRIEENIDPNEDGDGNH